jgi:hypothetical protein
MVALLTRIIEWLDYLLAEGAQIGPTRYSIDTFGKPEANGYATRTSSVAMMYPMNNPYLTNISVTTLNPLRAALDWNFATFRRLQDHYSTLHDADF